MTNWRFNIAWTCELVRIREKSWPTRRENVLKGAKISENTQWLLSLCPVYVSDPSSRFDPPVTQSRTAHTFVRSRVFQCCHNGGFRRFFRLLPVRCILDIRASSHQTCPRFWAGILSKKKVDHRRFEGPYKECIFCWISTSCNFSQTSA
jgi:hypothetical protein